ncbi:hypothetical protein NIES2119_31795 [[Phormidium ambiguum] IAM M-71]|uniref:Uncharacterized protein n=1 Tax=[Phormidium ambiguum] IAM M-71 TaxID=454136 RepID=A0A1U7I1W2_9CYAN|nr:hypothetical protein [Phormidium ambiguum]OKH29954.1 hypothetical protein NIES2119_31795 [Phormidium ambiguum IAM M-71]
MRGNPNPIQTTEFKERQFKPVGEIDTPLARKPTSVKLPQDVAEELDSWTKEERVLFLRSLITKAVREKVKQAG